MLGLDQIIPFAVLGDLPLAVQEHLHRYCYSGEFVLLTVDNDRFVNHCETPTMRFEVGTMTGWAIRDIMPGEELTEDYRASGWRGDSNDFLADLEEGRLLAGDVSHWSAENLLSQFWNNSQGSVIVPGNVWEEIGKRLRSLVLRGSGEVR